MSRFSSSTELSAEGGASSDGFTHVKIVGRPSRGHRFGLDLIRCGAILCVLVCHFGAFFASWAQVEQPAYLETFGYYGVELFFTLSGFLIGGILFDAANARPTVRVWVVFMVRRWMRTLPLYVVWLIVLACTWPPGLHHDDWTRDKQILPWFMAFSQNLAWPMIDWFPVSWSLAIEEWFYLTFSIALLAATRVIGPARAACCTLLIFLCVPVLLRFGQNPDVNWNEFLHKAVVFRLDAIAFGVGLAFLLRTRVLTTPSRLAMLICGGLIIAVQSSGLASLENLLGRRFDHAMVFDVTSVGFALLLPAFESIDTPPAWLNWPVRTVAALSYSIYMTHYTLLEWVAQARWTTHWTAVPSSILAGGLIVAVSAVSWYGFEKRILAFRPR